MSDAYITVKGCAYGEIEEKKSKFIARVQHVETEEEALTVIQEVKAEHRTARHHVYAYVLRADNRVRYSDDGEPQKTAGLPTLDVITHQGLSDVIVVTTRYFGGTLLGTGGLVRAYTQSAQVALEAAEIVQFSTCIELVITVPYGLYDQVLYLVNQHETKIVSTDFTDVVKLVVHMKEGTDKTVAPLLQELVSGQECYSFSEPFEAVF